MGAAEEEYCEGNVGTEVGEEERGERKEGKEEGGGGEENPSSLRIELC